MPPSPRRVMLLLAGSYALMWAGISITAGPGPATLVAMTGRAEWAGLFFATFSVAAALGAAVGGRAMDRFGRRPGLVVAHVFAAGGYLMLGLASRWAAVPLFFAGIAVLASGTGAAYLTRMAAAEAFPPERRARGMAGVLVGAAVGALLGPALVYLGGPDRVDVASVWFYALPLSLGAAGLALLAPESSRLASTYGAPVAPATARRVSPSRRPLVAGFVALGLTQAAMVGMMGVAGAALAHEGHGAQEMAGTLALHFVGMFAFSPVVGVLADRWGRRPTVLAGAGVLAAGGVAVAQDAGLASFIPGLFLVGLGWCFAYVAATTMVADVAPVASRGRLMGLADLSSSMASAVAAAAGGLWLASYGLAALGWVGAALMAVPVAFVLTLREPSPGAYGAEDLAPA